MSFHIVDISAPSCSISCREGQIVCDSEGKPGRSLPIEDVAAILVNSFSATFHSRFLVEAAKHRVAVIVCENFRPVSLVLPANRATDTVLTRAQALAPAPFRAELWRKTIQAKCQNQLSLAEALCPDSHETQVLRREVSSKGPGQEAKCARTYWRILAKALGEPDFVRHGGPSPLNSLLNYGYAVLLARMLQKLMAVGIDPTFGIGHVIRERATPLAYDLMEPFRPVVDARIVAWIRREGPRQTAVSGSGTETMAVSQAYKKWVHGALDAGLAYAGSEAKTANVIEMVARSFRSALTRGRIGAYRPWIQRSSRWDGLS